MKRLAVQLALLAGVLGGCGEPTVDDLACPAGYQQDGGVCADPFEISKAPVDEDALSFTCVCESLCNRRTFAEQTVTMCFEPSVDVAGIAFDRFCDRGGCQGSFGCMCECTTEGERCD